MKITNQKSIKANYFFLFKAFLLGSLVTEIILFISNIVNIFIDTSILNHKENWLWIFSITYLLMITLSILTRRIWGKVRIIIKSYRFDLLIVFFAGACLIFTLDGFGIEIINKWMSSLSWLQITVLLSLPIVFFISLNLRKIQIIHTPIIVRESQFMSDREGQNKIDDEFEFYEYAERFAERVFNQGSSESLVFGIDAPWGTGKSTFVNLCKEYWNENYKNEIIVYTFDHIRFENNDNIFEKFIDGLLKEIKKHIYAPEVESLVSKYAKLLIDTKVTFSFLGVKLGLPFEKESVNDVFERLENVLQNINQKIVIVIDDLDRLNFSSIKEILFVIKKSFTLPNISYVLCYDTENITVLDQQKLDSEKITEFLEKFVNIKTSLYLDSTLLLKYFTDYKDRSLNRNLLANPELVSKAVEGLRDIFNSNEYYLYIPFIGDARKLKRLINTILMLDIEKIDFANSDVDKHDLIHLLMIYINYPNIFRKIYNSETQGKRGFFSAILKYDDNYPVSTESGSDDSYKNSIKYTLYLKNLTENQQFILNRVFDVNKRLTGNEVSTSKKNITQDMIASYACFNGSRWSVGGRNLEQYLNLLTKMSRPIKTEQHRFYVNIKKEIFNNIDIKVVLENEEFSLLKGEANHQQLWRVLINSANEEFTTNKSIEIIKYALYSLPHYSILEIDSIGVGFRHTLPYFIVKLLDKIGWTDIEDTRRQNNTEENIAEIAQWIFGENKHKHNGILDYLGKGDRGVIGLYDLLLFRLCCCSDRGGDIFNLSRSLSKHGSLDAPISGIVREIVIEEMREISQRVFQIFKLRYIDKEINIFEEIWNLTPEDVCGQSTGFIISKLESDDFNVKLLGLKSRMIAFIIYQMGSTIISSGVPCGYYDCVGNEDMHDINTSINDYLFEFCFNPDNTENNYKYFLDYLLINFQQTFEQFSKSKPHIDEFTKVLDRDRLATYWKKHGEEIKFKEFNNEARTIIIDESMASYAKDLESTYAVLDELIVQEIRSEN